ncbi:DEAD/DEAH box helicase family protein [Corallococcus interemptor]|uniref:DEAD/DEAH box helicase family protein n=1 Tax=Corallococcus interemptor TaxID=2316720 RepID=UPI003CFDAA73
MSTKGDKRTFRNEDLVLRVSKNIDPETWDETRYEAFLDELCEYREYQKEAIRTTLRFLLGGKYANLRALAKENFDSNIELQECYGSWAEMDKQLQLPNQLACSVDQATGTGKSYVLYGLALILLAEGVVDRALVLCPSNTIEDGLLEKFKELSSKTNLRDALPVTARLRTPKIINASESIVEGAICIENYHAILENTKSSIRESLKGKGARVVVLNDEAHHVANESGTTSKKWKEFLENSDYGFNMVVGVSGTCYVADAYFSDVVHRYSLRQAIEEKFVKKVEYVHELPAAAEKPEEKWQLVFNRHKDWTRKLKARGIRPLTIVVTKGIADAELISSDLQEFIREWEGLTSDQAQAKVLCVTSAAKHQPNIAKLRTVDSPGSKVEWIVSVSMLSEGWDVKNVFQIVPHEERAFNSRLLISQVLGRGLRRPDGWRGEEPVVTVFNHDSWSNRIKQLVNEILEIERRLTSTVNPKSPYNFELHNLDYTREEDTTTYTKKGEYKLFEDGYVDLPTQVEAENVTVGFERAVTGEHTKFQTTIRHKTWSAEEVAEEMSQRLKSIDDESKDAKDPEDRTSYAKKFPLEKCEAIVAASLRRAKIRSGAVTDDNRQRFLQALGPLRRKAAKRVVYRLSPKALVVVSTSTRQNESCSAAELRRGAKTAFYALGSDAYLAAEQKEFFREVQDPDGEFRGSCYKVENTADFKTPASLVLADATPERKFVRELVVREHSRKLDGWLKNTAVGFYSIEYAWKKGTTPKRGEFSPDFFIRQGERVFVVEVKGDEEAADPSADNIKKHEYATRHFERLNVWLEKTKNPVRYQFNMISPKSYSVFFSKLVANELIGFRSEIDVVMTRAAKAAS